jgi:poly(3-hydroxybutyrate) depolymerase
MKKVARKLVLLFTMVAFITSMFAAVPFSSFAQETEDPACEFVVSCTPSANVVLGGTITISVGVIDNNSVDSTTTFAGAQFDLNYDKTVFKLQTVTKGSDYVTTTDAALRYNRVGTELPFGEIVSFTLKAIGNTSDITSTISLSDGMVTDITGSQTLVEDATASASVLVSNKARGEGVFRNFQGVTDEESSPYYGDQVLEFMPDDPLPDGYCLQIDGKPLFYAGDSIGNYGNNGNGKYLAIVHGYSSVNEALANVICVPGESSSIIHNGDVNADGEINIADAQKTYYFYLNPASQTIQKELFECDLYGKLSIDITNSQNIINKRLGSFTFTTLVDTVKSNSAGGYLKAAATGTGTVTVGTATRSYTYYTPAGATQNMPLIYIIPDEGVSADTFLATSGWKEAADNAATYQKFSLMIIDGKDGWNLDSAYSSTDSAVKLIDTFRTKAPATNQCSEWSKYIIGYGKGGTLAQMAAMYTTTKYAGVVSVDAGQIPADWLLAQSSDSNYATDICNNFIPELRKRTSVILRKDMGCPVWFICGGTQDSAAINYWFNANGINPDRDQYFEDGVTKYYPTAGFQDSNDWYLSRDAEAYRVWISGAPANLTEGIWSFLNGVRKFDGNPGGDCKLNPDLNALGMDLRLEKLNNNINEWLVYIPDTVDRNAPTPLVIVNHGSTVTGPTHMMQTGWKEVADKHNLILLFPTTENEATLLAQLDDLEKSYKVTVDHSRIYYTGHSLGSSSLLTVAASRPELFAAIAPISSATRTSPSTTEAQKAKFAKYNLPVLYTVGSCDDLYVSATADNTSPSTPSAINVMLNGWLTLNGMPNVSNFGTNWWTSAEGTSMGGYTDQTVVKGGYKWYDLKINNAEGIPMVNYTLRDYWPHSQNTELSMRVYENFLCHYKRDQVTGKIIYSASGF